jgi:hemoglobin-like flavoprotein
MHQTVHSYGPEIEASLEAVAARGVDPTAAIYERLFLAHPELKPLFWRDDTGAIRGEMLARVFEAILDFIGERRYSDHMIGTELITHEGYDVPREAFATFFANVGQGLKDVLGPDWTPGYETAWTQMLADIDGFVRQTPRSDLVGPDRENDGHWRG